MPIRVQMPNGTVRPFREGTSKPIIRKAQADMLADMKASGHYDDCDFSEFDDKPKRKVAVTQDSSQDDPLKKPFQVTTPFTPNPAAQTDPLADAIARSMPVPQINVQLPPGLLKPLPDPDPRAVSIAKRVYNEGASFRGNDKDLQDAFRDMAYAIVNRQNAHMPMDKNHIAQPFIVPGEKAAIVKGGDAGKAWGNALDAAERALSQPEADPTNGATLFFHHNTTHPEQQKSENWANQPPETSRGPFTSPGTTGNDSWTINTYHDEIAERRARIRAQKP